MGALPILEPMKNVFGRGNKNRLIALVVGVLTVAFLSTAILSYAVSHARMRDQIVLSELPLTSDTVYSQIQNDFLKPIQASQLMASDTFLRDWALQGEKDIEAIKKYLAEQKRVSASFTTYFVSGLTHHYYTPDGILKTVSTADDHDVWFFSLVDKDVDYVLDVDTDQKHDNALTIFINYRVFDYAGKFIGITGMGLNVDAVRRSIEQYQERFERRIYFVDQSGQVAVSSEGPENFTDIRTTPGLADIADKILNGEGGALEYVANGETHLLNVRYIPELKWYLFVERVEEIAMRNIRQTLYVNLFVALLATVLVAGVLAAAVNSFHAELDKYATTDGLTGLTNRRAFDILFRQAVLGARRNTLKLSVILLDIDHFKKINDQHGHLVGDHVLKSVSDIITSRARASDIVCRWGGEEILILLQECNLLKAVAIANDIRREVANAQILPPDAVNGSLIPVTVSAGVAEMGFDETEESVLARADSSLYKAKDGGRNQVQVADGNQKGVAA